MATSRTSKKLYSTVLVEDGKGRRRSRKARERAAQQVIYRDRAAQMESEKAKVAAERAEARSTSYLPKGGEPGAAALRSYRRFRVPHASGHECDIAGGVPVSRRRWASDRRACSSGRTCTPAAVVCIRPVGALPAGHHHRTERRTGGHCWLRQILAREVACIPGRSHSDAASTCPVTRKASTLPLPKPSVGRRLSLGHGLRNRLNPLDEGYRPGGLCDAEWASHGCFPSS